MRLITKISSFMTDTAIVLLGVALFGTGITLFDHDIQVTKKEVKKHD